MKKMETPNLLGEIFSSLIETFRKKCSSRRFDRSQKTLKRSKVIQKIVLSPSQIRTKVEFHNSLSSD